MPELSPELASKVGAADLRNQVKAVGDGGVLPTANRQAFLTFAVKGDPDAIREAREMALLQKWLSAGKLSKEERAEIEHILQPVPSVAGPQKTGNGYQRAADDYGHIGVARRTFFRWKAAGDSNPGGPDLPPFDDPQHLETWYEGMRSRGVFNHRFPKAIREAIALHLSGTATRAAPADQAAPKPTSSAATSEASAPPPGPAVPTAFMTDHTGARGLQHEVEAEEKRVASLRRARDQAYADNKLIEGDGHDRRYREALDSLSLIRQRWMKMAIEEEHLVHVDDVAAEFGPKHQAIVQQGLMLFEEVDPLLAKLEDRTARRAVWRDAWRKLCGCLVEGKFAPPLQLEQICS